ncbi:MAG TPA: tetratricopeptide repeat protein [Terriglobia bacterium]|nr:tetratricopeptide repeat protein [Terriglobia bacterium]
MERFPAFARTAGLVCAVVASCSRASSLKGPIAREKAGEAAQIVLTSFPPSCTVELDARPVGKTGVEGALELDDVEPGDHYVHVACAGQAEQVFFISPKDGESAKLLPQRPGPAPSGFEATESRRELRRLVQTSVEARNAGNADEAIADLRRATQLDPENADLHRELGITFLLLRDWKRARVEYLEAIKHDPAEAESHNGLGYALDKLGDAQSAVKEFRKAMQLDPDDSTYREHYLVALAELEAQQERAKKKR